MQPIEYNEQMHATGNLQTEKMQQSKMMQRIENMQREGSGRDITNRKGATNRIQ